MAAVKEWALTVCAVCILISVLESYFHSKSMHSVIKLVLGLYILITIITPARNINFETLETSAQYSQSETAIDVDEIILKQTAAGIEAKVSEILAQNGVQAQQVSAAVSLTADGYVDVTEILVDVAQPQDNIYTLLQQTFGQNVKISVY